MNCGDTKGVTASCVRDCPLGGVARLIPVVGRAARHPLFVLSHCAVSCAMCVDLCFSFLHLLFLFFFFVAYFHAICGCFVLFCAILLWLTAVYVR